MSIAHRTGSRHVRVPRSHALTASLALLAQARHETEALTADLALQLDLAEPAPMQSLDSQSSARQLVRTLTALDAIGWPHDYGALT